MKCNGQTACSLSLMAKVLTSPLRARARVDSLSCK